MMLGRREAWPALITLGIGLLTLALVLKTNQQDLPLQPTWVMAVFVALYVVVQLLAFGPSPRAALCVAAMIAAQTFMALLMGWGYSAVEGQARGLYAALQHGLWDYLPGTALQFAFACMCGIVLAAWLEREPGVTPCLGADDQAEVVALPDLQQATAATAAVAAAAGVSGVGAALLVLDEPVAAGVWERDPQAALRRVRALGSLTGHGLNSISLQGASLLVRSEPEALAALLVGPQLSQALAHDLLRELWAAGERLRPEPSASAAPQPLAGS